MRYLIIIAVLLSLLNVSRADTVRVSSPEASCLSKSYIVPLEPYQAGRWDACVSMNDIIFYNNIKPWTYQDQSSLFYSDEFKWGGRYDLTTWYWNPPVESYTVGQPIPEPSSMILLMVAVILMWLMKWRGLPDVHIPSKKDTLQQVE